MEERYPKSTYLAAEVTVALGRSVPPKLFVNKNWTSPGRIDLSIPFVGAGLPDKLWCYAFIYAVYILNHRYNRAIKTMLIVKWRDANYEVNPNDM